jgi:alkanesulfonate monooxygenase SsuD/methylene tetrahydromethanopterin reductase-like flavin-dependent oxidoreductase (luciferase family)
MSVQFGVMILPEDPWRAARQKWRDAELLGFDHAWTYDHLNWRSFRDKPWHGAVPTLAAAAVETNRIRIGVLVASPNFRHPVPLAKDVTTLDEISGGRLVLGIGSGADGFDARMIRPVPWSRRERADRFAEFVELSDRLLSHRTTAFEGRYYHASDVRSHPPCRQRPRVPFAIAAAGPRGMRLAARFGQYWVTTGVPNRVEATHYQSALPTVRRQVAELAEACAATGRDPSTLSRLLVTGPTVGQVLTSVAAFHDAVGRYAAAGITDFVVQWPRDSEPFRGRRELLERVAADFPTLRASAA